MSFEPLYLTLKLAITTTAFLILTGIPLAAWLASTRFKGKSVIEAIVTMPLVLPPTVLGFYLLMAFSPANAFGQFLESTFGIRLVFSFAGLVIGSVIYSLPFMVQPVQHALESLPSSLREASATLGKSSLETLLRVLLPNIRPALFSGIVLSFAHTIGEFGVILMIGGNIPGETRTASIAIFTEVEALNYGTANVYALVLLVLTFVMVLAVNVWRRKSIR